jgi:hypothetical protein
MWFSAGENRTVAATCTTEYIENVDDQKALQPEQPRLAVTLIFL